MKQLLKAGLAALVVAVAVGPAAADCRFDWSCGCNLHFEHTQKSRCLTYTSTANPLPCNSGCCYSGHPAVWDGYHPGPAFPGVAYAPPPAPAYPAPVPAVPAAPAPGFVPPPPTPTMPPATQTGLQQAGFFHYPPTNPGAYGYAGNYGYGNGYGYGYGAGYFQAPSYWYGN